MYLLCHNLHELKDGFFACLQLQASFLATCFVATIAQECKRCGVVLQVGDTFVMNCLEEGNYSTNMKHFLKRFPPGADRLDGIEWSPAKNGSPVLDSGIVAYMECKVVSRMETADHWLTYAQVTDGAVVNSDKKTAVHRRKVANYY